MNEAVQLLKKLAAPATINMMSIRSLKMSRALLDSGATHALRMAASEKPSNRANSRLSMSLRPVLTLPSCIKTLKRPLDRNWRGQRRC